MLLGEEELAAELVEIGKILNNKAVDKLSSHIYSIERRAEDLLKSRDNWKEKYSKVSEQNKLLKSDIETLERNDMISNGKI